MINRERLIKSFMEMVSIGSPSFHERSFAEYLLEHLTPLGFDSQIIGGKRYDLASMGRRRAHATYHQSHAVDTCGMLNFGMDLTPLIQDDTLDLLNYVREHIERFAAEVSGNISKFV
jgi:hypothetical protein